MTTVSVLRQQGVLPSALLLLTEHGGVSDPAAAWELCRAQGMAQLMDRAVRALQGPTGVPLCPVRSCGTESCSGLSAAPALCAH